MVWREWPIVAALLAVAAAMMANPKGLLRATEKFMDVLRYELQRTWQAWLGFGWCHPTPPAEPRGFPPRAERGLRIAGACLAAAAILAFLGSA